MIRSNFPWHFMTKKICIESAIILILSFSTAFIVNGFRTDGIGLFHTQNNGNADLNANPMEMAFSEAMRLYHENKALFADARSVSDFEENHIRGAVSLPEHEMEIWMNDLMSNVMPDTLIITYCDGSHCALAEHLAEKLAMAGFTNVFYIMNGLGNWMDNRLPTEGAVSVKDKG